MPLRPYPCEASHRLVQRFPAPGDCAFPHGLPRVCARSRIAGGIGARQSTGCCGRGDGDGLPHRGPAKGGGGSRAHPHRRAPSRRWRDRAPAIPPPRRERGGVRSRRPTGTPSAGRWMHRPGSRAAPCRATPAARVAGSAPSGGRSGSIRSPRTITLPVITASSGCASRRSAARASDPGSHHVSSSQRATYGRSHASTPIFRPAAPRFVARWMQVTAGKRRLHRVMRAIGRAVIDDDNRRALRQRDEPFQRPYHLGGAVVGEHDDADARVGARHRDGNISGHRPRSVVAPTRLCGVRR